MWKVLDKRQDSRAVYSWPTPRAVIPMNIRNLSLTLLFALPALAQTGEYTPSHPNANGLRAARQPYIWNGTTLSRLYGTIGISCDHWAMWYFREGAPQTPGTQWGSDSGKTADEVTGQWQEALKGDAEWKKVWLEHHMTWRPSTQTYDNALGPICVSGAAFNTTPEIAQKLDQLTRMADGAGDMIKTVRESVNLTNAFATPRGKTPVYYDKTSVEEFLDHLSSIPQKIFTLRERILKQATPNMEYVSAQLTLLNNEISGLQKQEDRLIEKFPATPQHSKRLTLTLEACSIDEHGRETCDDNTATPTKNDNNADPGGSNGSGGVSVPPSGQNKRGCADRNGNYIPGSETWSACPGW